jgi:hypothetical protein
MKSKRMQAMRATALAVATVLAAAGCDDDDVLAPPAGGAGSNLTVTNSNPADGNATLTVMGTFLLDAAGTGFDELNLSEMTGTVGHDLTVTWNTNTHAINGVQHGWGSTTASITQCVAGTASPCDPSKVAIDFAGRQVTFTNLVLPDASGGSATCTLNGTARW